MRILWLQSGANIGGTELMNFRTWHRLRQEKIALTIGFLDAPGPMTQLYHAHGYTPFHLHFHPKTLPHVLRRLTQILRSEQPDIIHIFGLRANLLARPLAKFTNHARTITGQRSVDAWRRPVHLWLDRLTSRWIDLYLANCQAVHTWLVETLKVPPTKTALVYSGINASEYQNIPAGQLRSQLGIPSEALVLAAVGNLRAAKAHQNLLDAFHLLVAQSPHPCHLLLVGDGPERPFIQNQINANKLNDCVHLLGRRDDIATILADTDIKVLSSHWEGLPGAVMEAMAAGLPVVATAVGGVPELVLDGVTGRLVPPKDPAALATALLSLLNEPDLRRQMGAAGRERVATHFRLEDSVNGLLQVYERLLSPP